jgi:TMEM175 potassium channel family protein
MSHHESKAKGLDGRMLDRMLFFTDAVFAIVLTIMVLDLRVPVTAAGGGDGALSAALGALWHSFFAFFMSFLFVGMWWAVHMRITRTMIGFDWPTAVCNFLFLLSVALVPFACGVLGNYGTANGAWEIYWGVNLGCSLSLSAMWLVVSRHGGKLVGGTTARFRFANLLRISASGISFFFGICLAAAGQLLWSQFVWVLMFPLMRLAQSIQRKAERAEPAVESHFPPRAPML